MKIRLAEIDDLSRIAEIYNQAIPHRATADMIEVTIDDRLVWFRDHKQDTYPVYVAVLDNTVVGWCSISPYRTGRMALRQTAEISYYVDYKYHGRGVGTALVNYAINDCRRIEVKTLVAFILEWNQNSIKLLTKLGFSKWGFLPRVADFNGEECGHFIYGKRVW